MSGRTRNLRFEAVTKEEALAVHEARRLLSGGLARIRTCDLTIHNMFYVLAGLVSVVDKLLKSRTNEDDIDKYACACAPDEHTRKIRGDR